MPIRIEKDVVGSLRLGPRIQGGAEQLGGDIHDGDHTLIGHAGWPNDAQHANDFLIQRVRGGDDTAIVEDGVARFLANEDLHAFGFEALVEQMKNVALLRESFEQAPQLLDVESSAKFIKFVSPAMTYSMRPPMGGGATTCWASRIASSINSFRCSRVSFSWLSK